MCLWFLNHKFQHKSKVQYHIQLKACPFCHCRWGSWLKATRKKFWPVLPSSFLAPSHPLLPLTLLLSGRTGQKGGREKQNTKIIIIIVIIYYNNAPVIQLVKNPPAVGETQVQSLGWEDPWRREGLPTPVFWPGEFHGLYSPWGHKESDTTEWRSLSFSLQDQKSFHLAGALDIPSLGSASSCPILHHGRSPKLAHTQNQAFISGPYRNP